jgi:hypothetical protein
MSSIPSLANWIETASTCVAVRPDLRDNLREELEQWLAQASVVQVSGESPDLGFELTCDI